MSTAKASVVFICSRLDQPAGTERAIVNLANLLASNGHDVTILILDETGSILFPLLSSVNTRVLPFHFGLTRSGNFITRKFAFRKHTRLLKQQLEKINADVVISTDYVFTIAAWITRNKNVYSWEHHHFHWLKKSRFWNYLYRRAYPGISAVIALNKTEGKLFSDFGCNVEVIPNFIQKREKQSLQNKKLLTVGWLIGRKGVDFIPTIAKKVFEKHPDWSWEIIGKGEEKHGLSRAISSLGLDHHLKITEPSDHDLTAIYSGSSVYVLTSRSECFPMVLLEAMSVGMPCIAFDCPTGPSDIITQGSDGLLIELGNTDAMAEAICNLIEDHEKRERFGRQAFENVSRFSPEKVYASWNKLLNQHKG